MINSIRDIINEVLTLLEGVGIPNTEAARSLVFETGMAESGYRHLEQVNAANPAISFFQIEPWVCQDIWENFVLYRKPYIEVLYKMGLVEESLQFCLFTNIALAAAFCRINYRRKPGSIPVSMPGRAAYWKKFWNTSKGKGTVDHYVAANMPHIDPREMI